jgi:hypothetical protein
MKRSRKKTEEKERKVGGFDNNAPSTLELSEGLKEFCAGLINQVNTSLDSKIGKLNEEITECNRNYQ